MGEGCHELHANPQETSEAHVLEQYRHARCRYTLADTNLQDYLRIGLVTKLVGRQVRDVSRCESQAPVHHDNIIGRAWMRLNLGYSRCFGSEGELRHAKRVQERWAVHAEDLVHGCDDRSRENGLVNEPEPVQEIVDPVGGLMRFHETSLDEFALDIISGTVTNTSHGRVVVRAAEGEDDEEPAPAEVESCEEVGNKNNLDTKEAMSIYT